MVPTILAHLARKRLSASPPTGAAPKEQHSAKFKALKASRVTCPMTRSCQVLLSTSQIPPRTHRSTRLNLSDWLAPMSLAPGSTYTRHQFTLSPSVVRVSLHANHWQIPDLLHWSRPPTASGTIDMTIIGKVPVTGVGALCDR
jgi:hypothetical protein